MYHISKASESKANDFSEKYTWYGMLIKAIIYLKIQLVTTFLLTAHHPNIHTGFYIPR